MFLLLKIFWSLDITAVAVAILIRISAVQELSLDNVAPRYLNPSTSSSLCPLMMMLLVVSLMLLTMTLDFSVLISMAYAPALSTSFLVSSCSSWLLPAKRSISSANLRLHIALPLMEMDVWWSWRVSSIICSRNRLKSIGDSKHPCLTPTVVGKE